MGKPANKFNGGKTRTVQAPRGKRPEVPVNSAPSNAIIDRQAMWLFTGVGCLSIALFALALLWGATMIWGGIAAHTNWWAIVTGVAVVGGSTFLVRSLVWFSFFAGIMYAMKNGAWQSQERLCRGAIKWWRLFPGGATTASTLLVQSLVTRGQYPDAIEVGNSEFEIHGKNAKASQSMAGMYLTLGMACQIQSKFRDSITWNDRATTALEASIAELSDKKHWLTKVAGSQAGEWAGSLRTQLTVAAFNSATSYFNQNELRQAKQYYKKALEYANQAPAFPEKPDLVKASSEQLSRLKHA